MLKRSCQSRDQLVLELEPVGRQAPPIQNPKGVVMALADLLLSAVGASTNSTAEDDDEL